MPFTIVRNDITKMNVDAIVNAANTQLLMGGGVCGAIFEGAGADKLQKACRALSPIKTGEAVITLGFDLPAKYIIHTAGPVYKDGKQGEGDLLRASYINSLRLAAREDMESIAFPLISSGVYGYPKAEAFQIAAKAIKGFVEYHDMDVYLVVFDRESLDISRELMGEIEAFIDENYVEDYRDLRLQRRLLDIEGKPTDVAESRPLMLEEYFVTEKGIEPLHRKIEDVIGDLDEPFAATLFRMIDHKGFTDVEVYKKANLDRRLFSKMRSNAGYMPSKRTAIALAIALELTLEETHDLLRRAGYTLSRSQKFDVIIEYFIIQGSYDIFKINEILFSYDQPLLGGVG
ncbi:MAG TPA: macro domain-containing protein [Clostridia bacterium]|nr:macro domain-containing protein [Clostridia bacterium]